jgi:prepilin-type processing-associated H-X9-DG protein
MVTLVIVVVLASFVFIGTTRIRAAADKATSIDNLRKLQLANGLFASDNNARFAACYIRDKDGKTGGIWNNNSEFLDYFVGVTQPERGNSQESRALPKHLDQVAYKAKALHYDRLKASYGMISKESYNPPRPDVDSSYRMSELTTPGKTASFVTAVNWLVQYSGRNGWDGVEGKINAPRIAYRHNNKALVAFYDGHVEELTQKDILKFDRRGGQNNSFWKGTNGRP